MAECINREELRAAMQHIYNDPACPMHIAAEIEQIIDCAPAADVAPVVHGYWIRDSLFSNEFCNVSSCSQCGELVEFLINPPRYCPSCGARMDGGDNDATD